jgi:hypothetical protein
MDTFGFTPERKNKIARQKKKDFKRIKKQIKKARKSGRRYYTADDFTSLATLIKLDKAGFNIEIFLDQGLCQEPGIVWRISW